MAGNLAIVISADSSAFISNMYSARDAARESMLRSSDAVDAFQSNMDRRSLEMQDAMNRMGGASQDAAVSIASMADQTTASVNAMTQAVNDAKFDSVGQKVAAAVGVGMGAGYAATESWLQKTEGFVKTRLEIIGVAIVTGVAVATVGALYLAYKSVGAVVGFIEGLFTGDSYKSKSIDALIAQNEKVVELQKSLQLSAVTANGLQDALSRLGVPKEDYVAAWNGATNAMRTNGQELDRLGVRYKDTNGKLVDNETFLKNAKAKLDEYSAGWDRNQAAAAMGAGSYDQISNALKVSQEEIQKSKDRLDDYNLGIGTDTQEAVDRYNQAMRDFNNEMKLTSDGFSRAWADQIMPVLTDIAEFLKDGWPYAVNVFRYSMATITSLFYGLKEVASIIIISIVEPFNALNDILLRIAASFMHLVKGDYKGAVDELKAMPDDLSKHWDAWGQKIVDQSEKNTKAMKLAWGFDNRSDPTAVAGGGKAYEAAPKPDANNGVISAYDKYLAEIQRMTTKVDQGAIAEMTQKAQQLADAEGRMNTAKPEIDAFQKAKETELMKIYTKGLEQQNEQYAFQTTLVGKTAQEQEILNLQHKNDLELQTKMLDHERTIGPLTAESRAAMIAQDKKMTDAMIANIEARRKAERDWATGANSAMASYIDNATNTAQQMSQVFSTAFKGMEDAMVNFAKTGKLNFTSLADTIITMLIRIATQKAIAGMAGSLFGPPSGQPDYSGSLFHNANGNAFMNGRVQAFADGGVVNSPTLFPFAGGTGLMGEAGPEAIMPLKRGADGKLGVAASAGGGASVSIVVNVDAQGGVSTKGGGDLSGIGKRIGEVARAVIVTEMRPGGILAQAGVHA